MTNHEFILNLLKDGYKHCSNELPFRDERARVGELRRGKNKWGIKFDIGGEPCKGRCGRVHNSDVHWLWLVNPSQVQEITLPDDKSTLPEKTPVLEPPMTSHVYPPVYEPKKKPAPYVYRPPENCCDVAIYCQTKRLPLQHSQKCLEDKAAIK
jgi:hypothetical protein